MSQCWFQAGPAQSSAAQPRSNTGPFVACPPAVEYLNYSADTICRINASSTLAQRLRRWTNAAPMHCVRWVGFHPNEHDANTIKPPSTQCRASVVDGGPTSTPRQTGHTKPMLVQCWASVADGGPTLNQTQAQCVALAGTTTPRCIALAG